MGSLVLSSSVLLESLMTTVLQMPNLRPLALSGYCSAQALGSYLQPHLTSKGRDHTSPSFLAGQWGPGKSNQLVRDLVSRNVKAMGLLVQYPE